MLIILFLISKSLLSIIILPINHLCSDYRFFCTLHSRATMKPLFSSFKIPTHLTILLSSLMLFVNFPPNSHLWIISHENYNFNFYSLTTIHLVILTTQNLAHLPPLLPKVSTHQVQPSLSKLIKINWLLMLSTL